MEYFLRQIIQVVVRLLQQKTLFDYNWHTCSILFSITLDQFTEVSLLWWISLKFSGYSILQKQIVSIMHVFIKQYLMHLKESLIGGSLLAPW